jgi:hypothetical protein
MNRSTSDAPPEYKLTEGAASQARCQHLQALKAIWQGADF